MRPHEADIRLLLELYADGELSGPELADAERVLETDPTAKEYLLALEELRGLVALPIEHAAEDVSFDDLFARVAGELDAQTSTIRRTVEMDAMVVAFADGQIHDVAERERVQQYMAAHGQASEGFAALRDLGDLVRAPIEHATDQVNFTALARRIDLAIDREIDDAARVSATVSGMARAPETPGLWARFVRAIGGPAVFASAATAAAVLMVMLPFTRGGGDTPDPVQIHNYYYSDPAEAVGYEWNSIEKGYDAAFQPGDKVNDMAPVLWITPDDSPGSGSGWEKDQARGDSDGSDMDTSL